MAISLSNKHGGVGNFPVVVDVAFDNNYPAGGYAISPATFGLRDIHWLEARQLGVGNRIVEYDYGPAGGKLKIFTALGTEAVGASDQSAITVRCCVIGPQA